MGVDHSSQSSHSDLHTGKDKGGTVDALLASAVLLLGKEQLENEGPAGSTPVTSLKAQISRTLQVNTHSL